MPKTDTVRQVDLPRISGGGSIILTGSGSGGGGSNAHTVDGYHASSTPTPGYLLALDASAQFAAKVIKWADVAGVGLAAAGNTLAVTWGTTPTTIVPDASTNGGSAATAARSDHTHAIAAAVAGAIAPGDTADEGTAASFARSDHRHSIVAAVATTLTVSTFNTEGNATSFARSNHTHAITSSSSPGANARILASTTAGYLQLVRLGAGVAPAYALQAQGTTPQLRIQGDASHYATFGADGSGNLTVTPSGNSALLPSGKTLSSANWASQTTGWGIYPESTYGRDGYADFRYIYADEMHVKAFIADLEQALAGGQIISKSVAILAADFTVPAKGATVALKVEDLPGTTAAVFASGDWIRIRNISRSGGGLTVADCYGTVGAATLNGDGTQTYTLTRPAGDTGSAATGAVVKKGGLALDYGVSGNGFWEVTTLDPAGSPYAQVATWATHPQNQTVRARLGNLDGIAGIGAEWGLWAGTDVNHQFKASSAGVELRGIPQYWLDASNNTRGAVDPTAGAGDYLFWLGPSSGDKRFAVTGAGTVYIGNVPSANVAGWAHSGDLTTIDGGKIAADTVTASALLVHGANWLTNPGFETGTTAGWTTGVGYSNVATANPHSGKFYLVGQGTGAAHLYPAYSSIIPVEASCNYYAAVWVRNASGAGSAGLVIEWLDASDAPISTAAGFSAATTSWALKSAVAAAPSNARSMRLYLTIRSDNASGVAFDDAAFYQADGRVLVGTPQGARVEITNTGIEGYSDASTRQFYLDAGTGRGTFGEGKGILDRTGLMLSGTETTAASFNSIRWLNGTLPSGTEVARISAGRWLDASPTMDVVVNDPQDSTNASLRLIAKGKVFSTHAANLYLRSWQGSPYGAAAEAQLYTVDDTASCVWTLGQGSIRASIFTGAVGVERMRLQMSNTAAAPTFSIGGDVDTGIWQSAGNNLDFSTGGTNRLNLDSSGATVFGRLAIGDGGQQEAGGTVNFFDTYTWRTVATLTDGASNDYSGGLIIATFGGIHQAVGPGRAYHIGTFSKTGASNPVVDAALHSAVTNCAFQVVATSATTLSIQMKSISGYNRLQGRIAVIVQGWAGSGLTLSVTGYTN